MKTTLAIMAAILLLVAACTSNNPAAAPTEEVRLSEDYADALSIRGQLALGTVQLEEMDLAVDETQAAELLPLWRALQSLSSSDTAAAAEIDAVVNQIQDTLSPAQVQAIAAMALTADSLAELIESGELAVGELAGRGLQTGGDDAADVPAGGGFVVERAAGGVPIGPGGGFPGGGPGGGAFNLDEDQLATRQAALESGALGDYQERALMNLVIRLLAGKTGELDESDLQPQFGPAGFNQQVLQTISEATGIAVETLQSETAEGATLAEVIEAHGGDLAAVEAALVEALGDLPNLQGQDVAAFVSNLLRSGQPAAGSGE